MNDETFTLTPDEQQEFYPLLDQVHEALIEERGCYHPKFKPSQCALVTKRLWIAGVRLTVSPSPHLTRADR